MKGDLLEAVLRALAKPYSELFMVQSPLGIVFRPMFEPSNPSKDSDLFSDSAVKLTSLAFVCSTDATSSSSKLNVRFFL
jgi:hypothetical protein